MPFLRGLKKGIFSGYSQYPFLGSTRQFCRSSCSTANFLTIPAAARSTFTKKLTSAYESLDKLLDIFVI